MIYRIENPSETNQFEQYLLTQVKKTNFRASANDNRACLTQIKYSKLRIENSKIFNEFDKRFDLYFSLALAMNHVPFDVNYIFDR